MKRPVILLLVSLLWPMVVVAQVPEWHPTVVLKVSYGDGESQLLRRGYRAGGEGEGGGIEAFYVSSNGMFVVDAIRGSIRVFAPSGEYVKAIPLVWRYPSMSWTRRLGMVDMVVSGGVIYVLHEFQGADQFGVRNSVFTFDLATGRQLERLVIYVPTLGIDLEGRKVGAPDRLIVEGEGDVSVFDSIRQISYPLVHGGNQVTKEEQLAGIPGKKFGICRVIYDRQGGGINVLDAFGKSLVSTCEEGAPEVLSSDGRYMLVYAPHLHKSDEASGLIVRDIYDGDCNRIGCISLKRGSRVSCFIFGPNETFRFGPDDQLYECYDACDALYIYRWSK